MADLFCRRHFTFLEIKLTGILIEISLKFVSESPNDDYSVLIQVMVWHRIDKNITQTNPLTPYGVTLPQWDTHILGWSDVVIEYAHNNRKRKYASQPLEIAFADDNDNLLKECLLMI